MDEHFPDEWMESIRAIMDFGALDEAPVREDTP